MRFFKAHALGNDFILITTSQSLENISKEFILKINHRFTGIGADQILALDSHNNVKIWTENGAFLTLCGNGLRSLAKLLQHPIVIFNTDSGPVELKNLDTELVSMEVKKIPIIKKFDDHYIIDVGNLHKIFCVPDNSKIDILSYANDTYIVSFLSNKDGKWLVRTMENHTTKETLACGSASLACANLLHYLGYKDLTIHYKYGAIFHKINDEKIIQTGPAQIVAEIKFDPHFIALI